MILLAAFFALQLQAQSLERPPGDVHPQRLLVKERPGAPAQRVDSGTAYLRITATSAAANGELRLDALRLRVQ